MKLKIFGEDCRWRSKDNYCYSSHANRDKKIKCNTKNCPFNKLNEVKTCKIINGQFSWVLEVDGEKISFQGSWNADYFERHYIGLEYKIERVDMHNKFENIVK